MIVYKTFLVYEQAQVKEIEKFIWCEGVKRGHDPHCDNTHNGLYAEWIQNHAPEFRETHIVEKQIKPYLLKKAKERHGEDITPCSGHGEFDLTFIYNTYYLWFNTPDNSTHVVKLRKDN